MPVFSTESDVRSRFQLNDDVAVPGSLITQCINDAHDIILRDLDPSVDTDTPDAMLVTGETFLAGSLVFRALAARDAFEQQHATIGGQRIEEGKRFAALAAASVVAEEQAWFLLEPYVKAAPSRTWCAPTETVPVMGAREG